MLQYLTLCANSNRLQDKICCKMLIYLARNLKDHGEKTISSIGESSGTYACKYSTSLTIKEAMLMDVGKTPVKA